MRFQIIKDSASNNQSAFDRERERERERQRERDTQVFNAVQKKNGLIHGNNKLRKRTNLIH